MKPFSKRAKGAYVFVALMLVMCSPATAWSQQDHLMDSAEKDHLNVLTINLLFLEVANREARLQAIADFMAAQAEGGEAVDIVLLQEVVGGRLSRTANSSLDLQRLLAERGLTYHLRYRLANGVRGMLTVGNGILSRSEIVFTVHRPLPFVSEEWFEGLAIRLKRNVMMSRVRVEGFGDVDVYNTHLCADCDAAERLEQAQVLMQFLEQVESWIGGGRPLILGGDFNTDVATPSHLPVYELITSTSGFVDTYARANGCSNCCSEVEGLAGCTYGVAGNPFAVDPFTHEPGEAKRIDYIFTRGMEVESSVVVFNCEPWVSDHSGVLSKIRLR